jgi:hypothetical protein
LKKREQLIANTVIMELPVRFADHAGAADGIFKEFRPGVLERQTITILFMEGKTLMHCGAGDKFAAGSSVLYNSPGGWAMRLKCKGKSDHREKSAFKLYLS